MTEHESAVDHEKLQKAIEQKLHRERMLKLERVLRSFLVFFGMDENEMNAGMFREARELLGWQGESDRKWCDCRYGFCEGQATSRCVFRYLDDVQRDDHERELGKDATINELLKALERSLGAHGLIAAHLSDPEVVEQMRASDVDALRVLLGQQRSDQQRYDSVSVTGSGRNVETEDEDCAQCGHPHEKHDRLGICEVSDCSCSMYYTSAEMAQQIRGTRDLKRESEILDRKCLYCDGPIVLHKAYEDTGRPDRVRCTSQGRSPNPCGAIFRVAYEREGWPLQDVAEHEAT